MKKICIFCGSTTNAAQKYLDLADEVGQAVAKNKVGLVYGAGSIGLMGQLADSTLKKKGEVYGIIPKFMMPWEVCHMGLTDLKVVETMHERKKIMYDMSDGFIALPGGYGTLDELCEILTWRQLEAHDKPIWILNFDNFYDGLIDHFKKLKEEHFFSDENYELFQVRDSIEEILEEFTKEG